MKGFLERKVVEVGLEDSQFYKNKLIIFRDFVEAKILDRTSIWIKKTVKMLNQGGEIQTFIKFPYTRFPKDFLTLKNPSLEAQVKRTFQYDSNHCTANPYWLEDYSGLIQLGYLKRRPWKIYLLPVCW